MTNINLHVLYHSQNNIESMNWFFIRTCFDLLVYSLLILQILVFNESWTSSEQVTKSMFKLFVLLIIALAQVYKSLVCSFSTLMAPKVPEPYHKTTFLDMNQMNLFQGFLKQFAKFQGV